MTFASTRLITDDLDRMVAFYELVLESPALRPAPVFAEFVTSTATLAIGDARTVPLFAPGEAEPAANRSAILEFLVNDVEHEYRRLTAAGVTFVTAPALMPWGNRVFFLRDPDGNLVGLFAPETPEALARFADRH